MRRKHIISIAILFSTGILGVNAINDYGEKPVYIPPSPQRTGDPAAGYTYLTTGDFLKSGMPYGYFTLLMGTDKNNDLKRSGKNANVPFGFNVVKAPGAVDVVIPTCLQCHAQVLNDKLVLGLGNNAQNFTRFGKGAAFAQSIAARYMRTFSPKKYQAAASIMRSLKTISPDMKTEVQGVNAADRLAMLLVAHRDPQTLEWKDEPILDIPDEVTPTDVPAWWLLKKKHAMFYNGFGRGDFGRFLMLSNLLTVKDSTEAAEVFTHFADVLSYIKTIEPPKYPLPINEKLAEEGREIFTANCSKCHGTYGPDGSYPNLLIPESVIQTDSMLFSSNYQNPQFIEWFNRSWFANGELPARLEPFSGYIAPPLDGIWATAPYLHNGSVPSLEAVLNSKTRPVFWKRDFSNLRSPGYQTENLSVAYTVVKNPARKNIYNTTKKGYRNNGHYFGDKLSDGERKALLEYLKTL
jgi:Cytochrome c